jgi:hypothetical protein
VATSFLLDLDTTPPAGVTVTIDGGAAFSGDQLVDLAIATSDGSTTGYSMKIYGDVDDAADTASYRALEANAPWIGYAATKTGVQLSAGDGVKTVRVKVRDDVLNPSSEATDTITVDSAAPVTNVTSGPSPTKISKVAGARVATFTWQSDTDLVAYEVRTVPAAGSLRAAGTLIDTANGSTNMSGGAVTAGAGGAVTSTIDGRDLEAASPGDGSKRVKVFGQDSGGNWTTVA